MSGTVFPAINVLLTIFALYFGLKIVTRLRGDLRSKKMVISLMFLLSASLLFVLHAGSELLHIGGLFYAFSALFATLFLGLGVIFLGLNAEKLVGAK